jgi:hypothetical protein
VIVSEALGGRRHEGTEEEEEDRTDSSRGMSEALHFVVIVELLTQYAETMERGDNATMRGG